MGDDVGTVIETPANYQEGDFKEQQPLPAPEPLRVQPNIEAVDLEFRNTFSDDDIPGDKYHLPKRFKEKRISNFGHMLDLLEDDVNTALGGVQYQEFPRTKAQKDLEEARDSIFGKKHKYVEHLRENYGYHFKPSDLTQAELDKYNNYRKEQDALEDSELAKKAHKQKQFKDEHADPIRHTYSSALTAKTISDKIKDIPYAGKVADFIGLDNVGGFIGSNILGVGHEIAAGIDRPRKFIESGKDVWNNAIGAYIGSTSDTKEEIASKIKNTIKSGITTTGVYKIRLIKKVILKRIIL